MANVDFGDGVRKKYFVLLSECENEAEHFVVAFTTSQQRYQGETTSQCGCPDLPCFRIDVGHEPCFSVKTWVQFDNVHPIQHARFQEMAKAGATFVHKLHPDRIRAVLNCAKKSKDIAGRDLSLIDRTLKSSMATPGIPAPSVSKREKKKLKKEKKKAEKLKLREGKEK